MTSMNVLQSTQGDSEIRPIQNPQSTPIQREIRPIQQPESTPIQREIRPIQDGVHELNESRPIQEEIRPVRQTDEVFDTASVNPRIGPMTEAPTRSDSTPIQSPAFVDFDKLLIAA